jgi:hypothetical protein
MAAVASQTLSEFCLLDFQHVLNKHNILGYFRYVVDILTVIDKS